MERTFDEEMADRWQELMVRWEADNAAMADLVQSHEREQDAERQAGIRVEIAKLEEALLVLRAEIESLVKQAAGRRGKGDNSSFTMATVHTVGAFGDRVPPARIRGRRSS